MNITIHLSDHSYEDKAIIFPEALMPELMERIKALPSKPSTGWMGGLNFDWDHNDTWQWFCEHSTPTKGVEDADYFLDYYDPVESILEWE